MDPVPEGFLRLREAFIAWHRVRCARTNSTEPNRRADPKAWADWYVESSKESDAAADELERALVDGDLTCWVYYQETDRLFRLPPGDIAKTTFFGRFCYSDTISALGDEPLYRHDQKTPLFRETDFKEWLLRTTAALSSEANIRSPTNSDSGFTPGYVQQVGARGTKEPPDTPFIEAVAAVHWILGREFFTSGDCRDCSFRSLEYFGTTDIAGLVKRLESLTEPAERENFLLHDARHLLKQIPKEAEAWDRATRALFSAHCRGQLSLTALRSQTLLDEAVPPRIRIPNEYFGNPVRLTPFTNAIHVAHLSGQELRKYAGIEAWRDVMVDTAFVVELWPPATREDAGRSDAVQMPIRGFAKADEPLLVEMAEIIRDQKLSDLQAAMQLAHKARGGGTIQSKAMRLVRRFRRQ